MHRSGGPRVSLFIDRKRTDSMLKAIGWIIGIIVLLGLLFVVGILDLIF